MKKYLIALALLTPCVSWADSYHISNIKNANEVINVIQGNYFEVVDVYNVEKDSVAIRYRVNAKASDENIWTVVNYMRSHNL